MNLKDSSNKYGLHPLGILHVGASMLEEADIYAGMGIKTVVWVEALPHVDRRYDRSQKSKQMLYEGLVLSDSEKPVTLHVANNEVSSSILPLKRHSIIYPDVVYTKDIPMVSQRADKHFGNRFPAQIDTLITDTQGVDLAVIQGMGKLLTQIEVVGCEAFLNELYEGAPFLSDIQKFMADNGFKQLEFKEAHKGEWGNALFQRDPSPIKTAMAVPGLITEEELKILRGLVVRSDAKVVFETGTYKGRTATLFAELGAIVFTADDYSGRWAKAGTPLGVGQCPMDQTQFEEGVAALKNQTRVFPMVINTYERADDLTMACDIIFDQRKADLAFLDGNHGYEVVKKELALAESVVVRKGGVICGHDLDFTDTVGKALMEHRNGKPFETLSKKLWAYVV